MPKFDSLGDRMKFYEDVWGNTSHLMPLIPGIVRLDGRAFHTFTRGMVRPFDMGFVALMVETTKYLVEETGARIGYTQSDEITLVLMTDSHDSQMYFDGKINKINSVLASTCTAVFNRMLRDLIPMVSAIALPTFDCRCFNVPTEAEAVNALVWREQDATRNSIQMVGQANFSHKQLHGKSCDDIQEMLWQEKKINWNDTPNCCKRGTYVQRRAVARAFTTDEIDKLPPKHQARLNPALVVERHEVVVLDMPPITRVANVRDVVFGGCSPITKSANDLKVKEY